MKTCTATAFGAAWIGAYSPAYFLCLFPRLCLVFCYQAILNVVALVKGEFVIEGSHGCFACIDSADRFILEMPDYVIAGLLAAVATRLLVNRSTAHQAPPGRAQANFTVGIVPLIAWFQHTFYLDALNYPPYVMAQLYRSLPYAIAALLATIMTTWVFTRFGAYDAPPRHVPARIVAAIIILFAAQLVPLFV